LLAAAVDCAESVNHRSGMHANDFARRKTFSNDSDGALVIAMAEDWNHHRFIPDIEVRVAGREARLLISDISGHRKWNDVLHEFAKPIVVLLQNLVVLIGRVVLHGADNGVLINKSRDIVDVTVGIVAGNAF